MTGPRLSAGVLTADLTRLGAEMDVIRGRAHWAHVDVMDGSLLPAAHRSARPSSRRSRRPACRSTRT